MEDKQKEKDTDTTREKTTSDLSEPKNLFDLIHNAQQVEDTKPKIIEHVKGLIEKSTLKDKYSILFLYDDAGQINRYTTNSLYSALSERKGEKEDILLILYSLGGLVEPAYLISKCCKEYAKNKFVVAIPRQAKSAATLLAIGADEIHMGRMSELGPIDPQIVSGRQRYPALGLGYAVEYLASLSKKYPESADMFAKYLSLSLDLRYLGYLERVAESAAQYAVRLLQNKKLPKDQNPNSVSYRLVYSYKDHNFVIDKEEAISFLGEDFVKYQTPEYKLADAVHKFLDLATLAFRIFKGIEFKIIGDLDMGINLIKTEE